MFFKESSIHIRLRAFIFATLSHENIRGSINGSDLFIDTYTHEYITKIETGEHVLQYPSKSLFKSLEVTTHLILDLYRFQGNSFLFSD